MLTVTLEIPDDLAADVHQQQERLPEILALGLNRLPLIPATVYQYIFDFLASEPNAEEIISFRPTQEMQQRLRSLLQRSADGALSPSEEAELDAYERIEHFIVMLKSGYLTELAKGA